MTNSSEVETLAIQPHKLLILDARSYAAAVANRAKGGGCECPGGSSYLLSWPGYRQNWVNMCSGFRSSQMWLFCLQKLKPVFDVFFPSCSRVLSQLWGGVYGHGQHPLHPQEFPVAAFPLHSDAWSSQVGVFLIPPAATLIAPGCNSEALQAKTVESSQTAAVTVGN